MAKSTRGVRRGRRHPTAVLVPAAIQYARRYPPVDLSRTARARLAMVDWHRGHGANVSRTARHFGLARPTVYRWLARFDRLRLESLEDRSSAPRRRRRPTWTVDQLRAVRAIREAYPRWGKDKLRVLLRREGLVLSSSMIGRILVRLRRSGELREPVNRRRMSVHQRRWQRPYAIRKPADWSVERPGDLVELDTLDIRPLPGRVWKQFTARDVVSRWDTLELGRQATARAAAAMLDRLAERMPFPVRAISIDIQSVWAFTSTVAGQPWKDADVRLPSAIAQSPSGALVDSWPVDHVGGRGHRRRMDRPVGNLVTV